MATQTKRTGGASSADADEMTGGVQAAAGTAAEIGRQQMAAFAEGLSAMFRAAGAIQQAQLQMGERAALLHSQAAENLRKATSPVELMTIQSTLATYQLQEGMRYWQELSAALAKAGGQMMRPVGGAEAAGGSADGAGAASMMGAAFTAAAPMADALQQMFTAPLRAAAAQQPH